MKRISGLLILLWFSACASSVKEQKKEPEALLSVPKKERVLAKVSRMEIPRIEKQSRRVKVLIWGSRPGLDYGKEEIEVSKEETGYAVRIWLLPEGQAESLEVFKTVEIKIPLPGGHDIEAVGENETLTELIFIDEEKKSR